MRVDRNILMHLCMPRGFHFPSADQSGTHVAIVQGGSTLEWMANSFCDVVFVRGGMPEKAIHFAFPKDSEFVKLFNEVGIICEFLNFWNF